MKKILITLSFLCAIAGYSQILEFDKMELDGSRHIKTYNKLFDIGEMSYSIGLSMYETENGCYWYLLLNSFNCIPEDNLILLKLNDGQIMTFPNCQVRAESPYTPVYNFGSASIILPDSCRLYYYSEYKITLAELDSIETLGINKIRTGNNIMFHEKQYKHDKLGKFITKSKKTILDRAKKSIANKKTSIYDGF